MGGRGLFLFLVWGSLRPLPIHHLISDHTDRPTACYQGIEDNSLPGSRPPFPIFLYGLWPALCPLWTLDS